MRLAELWDAPTASFSLTADTARSEKINKLLLEYGDANAGERDLMRRVQADLPGTLNAADAMSGMSGVSLGANQITGYAYEGDALSGLTLVLNVAQPAQRSLTLDQDIGTDQLPRDHHAPHDLSGR